MQKSVKSVFPLRSSHSIFLAQTAVWLTLTMYILVICCDITKRVNYYDVISQHMKQYLSDYQVFYRWRRKTPSSNCICSQQWFVFFLWQFVLRFSEPSLIAAVPVQSRLLIASEGESWQEKKTSKTIKLEKEYAEKTKQKTNKTTHKKQKMDKIKENSKRRGELARK